MAQFDDQSVWVYQAFRPDIAAEAVAEGRFGAGFKRTRMSWIKPNFLWMMFRAGWATKTDQEAVLALRLRRSFFDEVLAAAVHSTFEPHVYTDREAWADAVKRSSVRLQWDPDHGPGGQPVSRRAIQLGLAGDVVRRYADDELLEVVDITPQVREQRRALDTQGTSALVTPREEVYPVTDLATASRLRVDG